MNEPLTLNLSEGPPVWYNFPSCVPFIASKMFLENWTGTETNEYFQFIETMARYCYFEVKHLANRDMVFPGDITAAYAPSIGSFGSSPRKVFVLAKWIGAPQGYHLPPQIPFSGQYPEQTGTWETTPEDYYMAELPYSGREILDGIGVYCHLKFTPGKHKIEYYEFPLAPAARFGFYLFEGIERLRILPLRDE